MATKRFKVGDKVRVLSHPDFNEKGKKLVGLEGVIASNRGDGYHEVKLRVDGKPTSPYLPVDALEKI
jgi:hypothetical protein